MEELVKEKARMGRQRIQNCDGEISWKATTWKTENEMVG